MNRIEGEQISALLDGEIEPESYRNTVSRLMDSGPEALDTYGRYRLIGDLMRDETAQVVHVADGVRAALREEPTVLVPPPPSPLRWLKPAAGAAVAASVAVAAIVIAPSLLQDTQPTMQVTPITAEIPHVRMTPQLVAAQPGLRQRSVDVSRDGSREGSRWRALDPELEERLNRLVIEHHEYAGRTGLHGPVSHIGVASYEAR